MFRDKPHCQTLFVPLPRREKNAKPTYSMQILWPRQPPPPQHQFCFGMTQDGEIRAGVFYEPKVL